MIFLRQFGWVKHWQRGVLLGVGVLALAACATSPQTPLPPKEEVDSAGHPIIQAGDVAIAGQLAAHSIMDLPEVADVKVPPLVRFSGVSSVVNGPVDTAPYTSLLRDRLLLLTREKLRFVERQLPPLTAHKSKHKAASDGGPLDVDTDANYRIVAQLRGNYSDDTYLLYIQFIDVASGQSLFNGDYRLRKEIDNGAAPASIPPPQEENSSIESTAPNTAPGPYDAGGQPPPPQPMPDGNSGLQ